MVYFSKKMVVLFFGILLTIPVALIAIEGASCIDAQGKEVFLNQNQQEIFEHCLMVQHLKELFSMVTFQGAPLFLTQENIVAVLDLMRTVKEFGIENVRTFYGDEKMIELFQVVTYLEAPEQIRATLASTIQVPLQAKIAELEKKLKDKKNKQKGMWSFWSGPKSDEKELEQEETDLQTYTLLNDEVQECLTDCSCEQLIKNRPYFLKRHIINPMLNTSEEKTSQEKAGGVRALTNKRTLDLSFKTLQKEAAGTLEPAKKITSLKGIKDIITLCPYLRNIEVLNIAENALKNFSIKELRSIFPQVNVIDLSGNMLDHIDNTMLDASVSELNLSNNPIRTLTIADPSQFDNMKIKISGNQFDDSVFQEKTIDKIKASLRSLAAKSKVCVKACVLHLRSKQVLMIWLGTLCVVYSIDLLNKKMCAELVANYRRILLADKEISFHNVERCVKDFGEELRRSDQHIIKFVFKIVSLQFVAMYCYVIYRCYPNALITLQQVARANPYAIALENDETGYEFPSNVKRSL